MKPAISQICTLNSSFEEDLKGYSEATGAAIEFWLTKLEQQLRTQSITDIREACSSRNLVPAAAAYQGGLLLSQGAAREEAWKQFQSRLAICAALAVPTLIVSADFLGPFQHSDIAQAQQSLLEAAREAAPHGVRLALEFRARDTFLNNLQTAVGFVESIGEPNVGLCLDTFQYYCGPSKTEDLGLLRKQNLFHVQFCDLADCPREIATDADRIMPGDGDFAWPVIVQRLREIQYDGFVSLELHNPALWHIPARQVGEIGLTALRVVLGQNSG